MTKLEELDELRGEYFNKFNAMFPFWGMSVNKAISLVRRCLEEGKQLEDNVPDYMET